MPQIMKILSYDLNSNLGKQYILSLLYCNNQEPINGKSRLMIELFFISLNVPSLSKELEFEADNYGLSSNVMGEYLNDMNQKKLIIANKGSGENITYSIGEYGKKFLEQENLNLDYELISEIKTLCQDLTNDELFALTYFSFPEMTKNSLVKEKILAKRQKLAVGLYRKDKVSLEKATEISGLKFKEFLDLMDCENMGSFDN
ncbi:hypothetical protein [Methanobrevibacter sp.]|uniref:hypothetical protein n=1 Tax=Methanobrevibacter sp. TaxID=66852 RepID=UPI00388CF7B1